MNKSFLRSFLQGRNSGPFKEWLDSFEGEPRIAWYPSAGEDFRALVFLDPKYTRNPPTRPLPAPPDFFLYTDYHPYIDFLPLADGILYKDTRSTVHADVIEELPPIQLPLHDQVVVFPQSADKAGRVFFIRIRHENNDPGTVEYPVLYVVAENESFCFERLLPSRVAISHIINVRYGHGFGGSRVSGAWLPHILEPLGCEVFISDGRHHETHDVHTIFGLYPNYTPAEIPALQKVREIPGPSWSNHGDVIWSVVSRANR